MTSTIERIFVYPVKSLGGIELESSELTRRGLANDRRFMLTDSNGQFVTQRQFPELALFKTRIEGGHVIVQAPESNESAELSIPIDSVSDEELNVTIWSDKCLAKRVSKEASVFFSDLLGQNIDLVYMPEQSERLISSSYNRTNDVTSFTDGFPILLIGTASLDDLNVRLTKKNERPVGWDRFRPSVVVRTNEPFEEDHWSDFTIGEMGFSGVKLCSRCVVTTIDQNTGIGGKEPLRTLAEYRTLDHKVNFGQNVIGKSYSGKIRRGDVVFVNRIKGVI